MGGGGQFAYLLDSDGQNLKLYLGIGNSTENVATESVANATFLRDTFAGIYAGSHCEVCGQNPLQAPLAYSQAMLGIPSLKKDSDKVYKQGLEKIFFPLLNKKFRILLVAQSFERGEIQNILSNLFLLGSEIHSFVKQSKNVQQSEARTQGTSTSESRSQQESESRSESRTEGESHKSLLNTVVGIGGMAIGAAAGMLAPATGGASLVVAGAAGLGAIAANVFNGDTENTSNSTSTSRSTSTTYGTSTSSSQSNTTTLGAGLTREELNKSAEYCEKLIEKYIERFQKGLNFGLWNTSLYIQGNDLPTLAQVAHTLRSVFSGDESFYESLRFSEVFTNTQLNTNRLPVLFAKNYENPLHRSLSGFATAINTEELSILASMPNIDVCGISVTQNSYFGLTQGEISGDYIEIGNIVHRGQPTTQRFRLSLKELNHHVFVSGITGSGKSNTIRQILHKLQNTQNQNLTKPIPFLVIEPAKSEYQHLKSQIPNLQIFRPGAKNDVFLFNPFVFEKAEELTKHVDMLKTSFVAAFPMEGPMPYILESALHRIYTNKGWDFATESNPLFLTSKDADYDKQSLLFPTMQDLYEVIDSVVAESGYAQEIDSNLKAALKTRILNLTLGMKGRIYNTRHCLSNEILFDRPSIIELSNIADDCEKSFLMGLLLNKLYRYRESQGDSKNVLRHICVIEEAHRLLPNISLESLSGEANAKGAAVQTFVNILAEIRSLGEGIIIADQIASKLHRDTIKNTGTKIIQRTMDKEDRDIVGQAINLNDSQILDIAELKTGKAIVHNKEVHQAFMVELDESPLQNMSDNALNGFYAEFLERHKKYQYRYLQESRFYLEDSQKIVQHIRTINAQKRKRFLLELLNAVLLGKDSASIEEGFAKFWNLYNALENNEERKQRIACYLFAETFNDLNFLGNTQYYKSIHAYQQVIEYMLDLIEILYNKETAEIAEYQKDVQKTFAHKNIAPIFPTMQGYGNKVLDYTLLILENIEVYNKQENCDEIMVDKSLEVLGRIDKILQMLFYKTSQELRHCLYAIRSKDVENNFFNLI